jgi:hypothetical protein
MNGTKRRLQATIFPLADDGETPDALLGVALFQE